MNSVASASHYEYLLNMSILTMILCYVSNVYVDITTYLIAELLKLIDKLNRELFNSCMSPSRVISTA